MSRDTLNSSHLDNMTTPFLKGCHVMSLSEVERPPIHNSSIRAMVHETKIAFAMSDGATCRHCLAIGCVQLPNLPGRRIAGGSALRRRDTAASLHVPRFARLLRRGQRLAGEAEPGRVDRRQHAFPLNWRPTYVSSNRDSGICLNSGHGLARPSSWTLYRNSRSASIPSFGSFRRHLWRRRVPETRLNTKGHRLSNSLNPTTRITSRGSGSVLRIRHALWRGGVQRLSYALQLSAELGQKTLDGIQPRTKHGYLLSFHSAPEYYTSKVSTVYYPADSFAARVKPVPTQAVEWSRRSDISQPRRRPRPFPLCLNEMGGLEIVGAKATRYSAVRPTSRAAQLKSFSNDTYRGGTTRI